MAIPPDFHYIPAFSIEDVLLDKDTGAPLSGGLVTFYRDSQRGVEKPVYQITGTSPNYTFVELTNPVVLSSIGTFEDALGNPVIPYFYPYDAAGNIDLYYVVVQSSDLVEQFTRQAQPYLIPSGSDTIVLSAIANELSNPQFAEVNFDTTQGNVTLTFSGVTDQVVNIAPSWDLVVTSPGAGSVTLGIIAPNGAANILTNPAAILDITSAGLTKLWLRQRLYGSPNLWGSGYLAATFIAKTFTGTSPTLNLYYAQSNGALAASPVQLVSASLLATGDYKAFPGAGFITTSNSTESFPNAYVDIYFDIPTSIHIAISSVMVASTGQTSVNNITYDQESVDRQIDHLFHYYEQPLLTKPVPSLLTGWDFPLNPAQALLSTGAVTMSTTAAYLWDQTIGKSFVGNIAVLRNTVTGGIQATTANPAEAFYYMQYLSGAQARKILGTRLSVNVNAFRTEAGGAVVVKVYLYRGTAAAIFPVLPLSIGSIDADGVFTLSQAGWTLIGRQDNLGTATGLLSTVNTADYSTLNSVVDLRFNSWEVTNTAEIADTNKFAIVVTFKCATTGTVVVCDSISVTPGDIPTRPSPQTADEVLRECQYYYRNSFLPGTVPAAGTGFSTGESYGVQGGAAGNSNVAGPIIIWDYPMRVAPALGSTLILYNVLGGGANQIVSTQTSTSWTNTTTALAAVGNPSSISVNGFSTQGTTPAATAAGQGCALHWSANARLGVI